MIIIKHGDMSKYNDIQANCKICEALFRFNINEAATIRSENEHKIVTISCPTCNCEVTTKISNDKNKQILMG